MPKGYSNPEVTSSPFGSDSHKGIISNTQGALYPFWACIHSTLLFSRQPSLSMHPFGGAKTAEMVVFGLNMR
jgi:hypothetical protein